MDLFLALPEFAHLCERASRGTTRRQRLNYEMFSEITIPWIPIEQQSLVVKRINAATGIASKLINLTEKARSIDLELIRQTFGFGWIEDNVERMHEAKFENATEGG